MHNYLKKKGRRRAGSYGRPGSKAQKRAASKAARDKGWKGWHNPNRLDDFYNAKEWSD